MAKRRTYSATSPIRHRMKMYRLVAGNISPELAMEFADMVNVEWSQGFGEYRKLWLRFRSFMIGEGLEVPVGLYGLIRSGLFKCYKVLNTDGENAMRTCLDTYQRKTNLPANVIDAIERFLRAVKSETQTAPSKT